MDPAISKKYRQLSLLDCIEAKKNEGTADLKTPKLEESTEKAVSKISQSSDSPSSCGEASNNASKPPKHGLNSLYHGKGGLDFNQPNQVDLLEAIDSDHLAIESVSTVKIELLKRSIMTAGETSGSAIESTSESTMATSPIVSGRNQPMASPDSSHSTTKPPSGSDVDFPVVIDLTKSPDSAPGVASRTGIKRKRRKLYYSPRKKARHSPQKSSSEFLSSETNSSFDSKLSSTLSSNSGGTLLGSSADTPSSARGKAHSKLATSDLDERDGSTYEEISSPSNRTTSVSPHSRLCVSHSDGSTEHGDNMENVESAEEECDGIETEYPMPSSAQQKEQRRLYRLRQLKEMRAREMMEARRERALKRRGEQSPSKKCPSSKSKKVSWKEENSLVSIFNYDDVNLV